jgi:LmbE family N-acetylglucosaminyl deacetylase
MKPLLLAQPGEKLSVLCLGAHADDIEIGAGGAILSWIDAGVRLEVEWCVLSADGQRAGEAEASAAAFLAGAETSRMRLAKFPDNRFPSHSDAIKDYLLSVRDKATAQVVLTHYRGDAHQDHREVCQLTWNLFRDHLILEYEIPKWDGDVGQPNCYVPLTSSVMERKVELLLTHFASQKSRDWFGAETFYALARLRGMECRASQQLAEAFFARKVHLA